MLSLQAAAQTDGRGGDLPDPNTLEAQNATIREIRFDIEDVFDPNNPDENKRIHRLANRFHIRSKQKALESILLPEPGDIFDARVNQESERALRARDYITEAVITPVDYDAASNTVALQVDTRDSWSLSPELKFSRTGGVNEYAVGLSEENLFGLGKEVTLALTSDVDRDETFFSYTDPNVRGTRTRLGLTLTDASDGHRSELAVGRPFFSFDSRWAVETGFNDTERIDPMYGLGEIIDKFEHEIDIFSAWGGWS
jgi:outer membrane protein assembly factor BamA